MRDDVLIDIREDFEELAFLCSGYKNSLLEFKKSLKVIKDHPSSGFLNKQTDMLLDALDGLEGQITKKQLQIKKPTPKIIEEFSEAKRNLFTRLRTIIPLVSNLITSTDWQSPSFAHSLYSEAGVQTGKIIANINDYKRDRHLNEEGYQKQFLKEYVDGLKFPANAYLTSSGMAALTTIITHLILQNRIKGPVLIGKSIYFENTELVERFFKDKKIIKVDEMDTREVMRIYEKNQPDLVLFDSLCNAPSVAVPDLPAILKFASANTKNETIFVIDNSTLSIALQPLKMVRLPSKLKLIVFESLNKYHQFGLDRVTAGIIWYRGAGFENFYKARVHAGTNIADRSAYALPQPNRKLLQKRLVRLGRNALFMAQSLETFIMQSHPNKIDGIVYPGLKSHASYEWSKKYFFQGSYFVISFKKPYQKVKFYQQFVRQIMENAEKKKISINGGTSFGFSTTRIYLTARNTEYGMPFVRVSLGTENRQELDILREVFEETIQFF